MIESLKMRKIERSSSHDNDSSQSDHIPLDLVVEILLKSPAKSIARCRSVSKLWSSITTTPDFINSFVTSQRPPCVLLLFSKRDKLFVFSSSPPRMQNYQLTVIPNNGFQRFESSLHGLICFQTFNKQVMVLTPTMKSFSLLPKLECNQAKLKKCFLGYDPIDGKYKALSILTNDKIGILTLGAQESWRILSQGFPSHWLMEGGGGVCINGVIYYNGFFHWPMRHAIMSFDLRSDKFSLIHYPTRNRPCFIVSYEGRLALVINSTGSGVELWILEDAENHRWIHKHFPSPPDRYRRWKLKGVTDAGEFIYIFSPSSTYRVDSEVISSEYTLYEWFRTGYFDPKKNSFREVEFRGIAVDDIRRLGQDGLDFMKDFKCYTKSH